MTTKHTPKKPAQASQPAQPRLRQLQFAFPFLRKAEGKAQKASPFTDEHELHRLLAEREPSGSYPVSRSGMWHGGIHVTEAGAGRAMDLDAGLRALADGHLIAYRANRAYPVSEFAAPGGATLRAPYSTGFALLRHSMEFPRGSALTFYSLYMHLMSDEDYANFPARGKPSYWTRQWLVTSFARDRPVIGRNGQAADARQLGLRVRTAPTPHSNAIGILPQGASVSIGKKEKGWGQLKDLHGAQLHPPIAGTFVSASAAVGGWICMGQENGGPLVDEVFPDAAFDQVVITAAADCRPDDAQGAGFCIRAGEPIGHMGRYDALTEGGASGTRMAHIEVFCDDSIRPFIEQSRAWISQHGPHREDWSELGLPADPTILRIGPNTVLNQRNGDTFAEGVEPQSRKTDVVQVYPLAGLARDRSRHYAEPKPDPLQQRTVNWWLVQSANMLGHPIEGWVRESNHRGGMVTREFSRKWIDFRCIEDAHDATHTIFANSAQWIDYASHAEVADTASRAKLSPLMLKVYDALFTRGDGRQAAVELCSLSNTERGGYPWLVQAASRLIVKHGSEWANPAKWTKLIAELDQRTGTKPQREEELKRIGKLAWWDEVKARVPGFPEPDVFHIHPIALSANFSLNVEACRCGCCLESGFQVTRLGTNYGPVYSGLRPMDKTTALSEMVSAGEISQSERRILVAISMNEGRLDTVHSYDSEIVTAGAMQKTINSSGGGEFPEQVARFKQSDEAGYRDLFEQCGWTVEGVGRSAIMHYAHPALTNDLKITGEPLRTLIRIDCSKENFGKKISSIPLAAIVQAISAKSYERHQLMDFIDRLRNVVLPTIPSQYQHSVGEFFLSDLGRATALDQSINRPAFVARDIGWALNSFFAIRSSVSKNPKEWGQKHKLYESEILQIYGPNRSMARINGINVAPARYFALAGSLS
ncbi:hypothetical protein QYH69_25680 [Paraburkholderia sp. SARCC-3016]|uniref:hypothetical protein n=1 Tax=Paraburkholderia sp. SARCC-3016 TaxID=3058611 RepID=UPI002809C7F6|nr:hypothetical protein [Paraburkholderia sp. SARCC-3016]MDQ7980634.1 hypothetical protein [Paraburkholderia sp. SARCC-3016]